MSQIAIIGAGLTGLMAALHLAQRDISVSVFEKRSLASILSTTHTTLKQPGRTMSMDISARGEFALKTIGAFEPVLRNAIPMYYRVLHDRFGQQISLSFGQGHNESILAVSRVTLFQSLLDQCMRSPHIKVYFDHTLINLDSEQKFFTVHDAKAKANIVIKPQLLIGADGVNSLVRSFIESSNHPFFSSIFPYSYKELTIFPSATDEICLNATHIWPREECMLVAQPNIDRSFTCALLLHEHGQPYSFASISSPSQILEVFRSEFPDALPRMPKLELEFFSNPVGQLKIVRGSTWSHRGFVLLLGDAAHGMVPFFGQGVNCCFEDCTYLQQSIDRHGENWGAILEDFDVHRVPEANAINELSLENYPELASCADIKRIGMKRKLEALLSDRYKSFYRTYHNLVCFDRVPYTFAKRIKEIQSKLLTRLTEKIDAIEQFDLNQLEDEMNSYREDIAMAKRDDTL